MSFAPTSPVTGAAVTGLTTPTYTIAAAQAPGNNGKKFVVTALGGTQTGVTVHSIASPFQATFWVPGAYKTIGKTNPVTGLLPSVPKNIHKRIVHKGMIPLAGQPYVIGASEHTFSIPAGSDTADPSNVKALLSFGIGLDWQQASGYADTLITGVL